MQPTRALEHAFICQSKRTYLCVSIECDVYVRTRGNAEHIRCFVGRAGAHGRASASSRGRLSEEWTCTVDSSVLLPESRRRTCQNAKQGLGLPSDFIASQHRDQGPTNHARSFDQLIDAACCGFILYCSWAPEVPFFRHHPQIVSTCFVQVYLHSEPLGLDCNRSSRVHILRLNSNVPY